MADLIKIFSLFLTFYIKTMY